MKEREIIRSLLLFGIVLIAAADAHGQPQRIASAVHFQHTIDSKVVGEQRTVLVRVPAHYERTTERYPVVYMLDAHAPQNVMMAGIVEQQAWSGVMPDVILVGIQNTNRLRDMTPTPGDRDGAGGAAKFLRFIETEVIPFVDKNYRTEPYRVIAGHSLAGLFVVYALAERPEVFNAYIAASPHLIWDKGAWLKQAEVSLQKGFAVDKVLFAGVGDEPIYMETFNRLHDHLKKEKPKGLEFEFKEFPSENHGSVVLPSYYAGVRKIFAGWQPPDGGSFADVEEHYRKLTSRFGYTITPPEALVNRIGYQMLNAGDVRGAIDVFRKNVTNYPRSANVYDSLGEAYEKSGVIGKARENYEKAWKMAEQNGELQLAATAKANYERVASIK